MIWWNSPFINQAEQIIQDEQSYLEHKGLDPSKIGTDVKSIWRHVRTRLYFTSASHLYTLFNVVSTGLRSLTKQTESSKALQKFMSWDYLSHMMIRLYENLNAEPVSILLDIWIKFLNRKIQIDSDSKLCSVKAVIWMA